MDSRVDIFSRHGVEYVLSVIQEEVEWFFGDWPQGEGIGTSDVGACYRAVIDKLDSRPEHVGSVEQSLIMNGIRNIMNEVLDSREVL